MTRLDPGPEEAPAKGRTDPASAIAGLPDFAQAPWSSGSGTALLFAPALAGSPGVPAWTYDRLTSVAAGLAERLSAQGLEPAQVVAVPDRPGWQLVLMQHALARLGAVLLPVPAGADEPALNVLLAATGAEWLWRGEEAGRDELARVQAGPRAPPVWPSPLALILATSGSSGAPRAAMLTQANLLVAAALSNRRLSLGPGDCWLGCLPLRHIGGISIGYRCALAGATLLLHAGFDAALVSTDLERHAVTHLSLVPPMLARLLALGRRPPAGLRVLLVGGQSLSPSLAGQAIDAGWPLHLSYGMTETASQVATSGRLGAVPAPGVVGQPLPGVELDCPPCRQGFARLRLRGPMVMAGYASPARTPGLGLAGDWLTTPDLACLSPSGDLCILGRADEVLVTGGVNVHPARVESALAAAPGVGAVAVVGVPDSVWGERLIAVYTGDATPADLDAWCRARLSGAERPRGFLPTGELPTLDSGKLDRRRLRDLARQLAREASLGG